MDVVRVGVTAPFDPGTIIILKSLQRPACEMQPENDLRCANTSLRVERVFNAVIGHRAIQRGVPGGPHGQGV
eukprot:CAMPEP_0119340878 /NCGR_PEP_ID=MMETSP1333-20130426/101199_1 /TAXON_ID=418940 /ORGANISM="Scyphosphaera apsteinii, Strain RCC1455" /LENGTH=71 /DNA_ID=CAMNT_0007352731 /DNA_START=330 /DNA_END=545 /DNA_ORIENTATION=-